jgi:hypothetical protein
MQTATEFTALGAGNGFPFCLPKINVNTYVKWVTLGGNKKGGAITEDGYGFNQAMDLFWNLYSFSGVCAAERTGNLGEDEGNIPSSTITVKADTLKENGDVFRGWENPEPKFRICEGSPHYAISIGLDDVQVSISADISASNAYAYPPGLYSRVCAMYNGDVNDKTKFVGYGLYSRIGRARADSITDAQVSLQSFQQYPVSPGYGQYEEYDYVPSLNGFYFLCRAFVYNQFEANEYDEGSHTLNPAGMSASSIVTTSPFGTGSAEASLTSSLTSIFDFYTY